MQRVLGGEQAKQGASFAIIGKSLNHKTQQTTDLYARLDLDPLRASVNSATAAMLEAVGLKKSVAHSVRNPEKRATGAMLAARAATKPTGDEPTFKKKAWE